MSKRPNNRGLEELQAMRSRLPSVPASVSVPTPMVAKAAGSAPPATPGVSVPTPTSSSPSIAPKLHSVQVDHMNRAGRAPYNFVPLPERVRWLKPSEEPPVADRYDLNRKSGVIDVEIEALTDFYIRGMWLLRDYPGLEIKDQTQPFQVACKLRIPGSSLHGMIRTLIEILSDAPLDPINDSQLHFRAVGSSDKPVDKAFDANANSYKARIAPGAGTASDPAFPIVKAGFLYVEGDRWSIRPSIWRPLSSPPGTHTGPSEVQWYRYRIEDDPAPARPREIYFRPPSTAACTTYKHHDTVHYWFGIVDPKDIIRPPAAAPISGFEKGYLICSGAVGRVGNPGHKYLQWIINDEDDEEAPVATELTIPPDDVAAYLNDRNRRLHPYQCYSKSSNKQPCFYIEWPDKDGIPHVTFGHTPYFRLPYSTTVGQANPRGRKSDCWSLTRQKFKEATKTAGAGLATVILGHIEELYAVEREARDGKLNPEQRKALRQEESLPILNKVKTYLETHGKEASRPSLIANAIDHTLSNWNSLLSYCQDGELEFDHDWSWDLPQAMFGRLKNKDRRGGGRRVFVEDGMFSSGPAVTIAPGETSVVLGEPKPTTYQHYVVQQGWTQPEGIHWDGDRNLKGESVVRGHKFYWHRRGASFRSVQGDAASSFRAAKKGCKFVSRIRFENLSDIELGSLFTALDLPPGCAHRLGMAKPLGFGSFELRPTLRFINREPRYSGFIKSVTNPAGSGMSFVTGLSDPVSQTEVEGLKSLYASWYLEDSKNTKTSADLWATPRFKELAVLLKKEPTLGYSAQEWQNATRYLELRGNINEYLRPAKRRVLPPASQVAKKENIPIDPPPDQL